LAAYGLNIDDLRTTISNLNVNTPKGNFDGPSQSYTINANDQLHNPDQYLESIVAYKNGRPVRMQDVADVTENALIGVQLAAYYPTINLSAAFGYAGNPATTLFSTSS
jgi:multidrug efflux pump subunit AcrB